jgi:hypothetical protein
VKTLLAFSITLFVVARAPRALACINDTDCGATCGGMVCSFAAAHPQTCVAASTGDPGWCTSNAGCQCAGATCNGATHYCSYTMPVDMAGAPAADMATSSTADMASAAKADLASAPAAAPDLAMVTSTSSSSGCAMAGAELPVGFALLFGSLLVGALALRRRHG